MPISIPMINLSLVQRFLHCDISSHIQSHILVTPLQKEIQKNKQRDKRKLKHKTATRETRNAKLLSFKIKTRNMQTCKTSARNRKREKKRKTETENNRQVLYFSFWGSQKWSMNNIWALSSFSITFPLGRPFDKRMFFS